MDPLLLSFALTALLIELTPGPNMTYLAALTLAEGRRTGLAAVAGVALGLSLIGALAVFGLASAFERVPYAQDGLRYAGTAYLFYLAWDGWLTASAGTSNTMSARAAFGRSLLTNILNPKSAAFYLAVLPLFLAPGQKDVGARTALLAILYVGIATIIHGLIVLFAARLRPYLVEGPHERRIRRGLALSLAFVAVWFFWSTAR